MATKVRTRIFKGSRAANNATIYAKRMHETYGDKRYDVQFRFAPGGTKLNPNYRVTVKRLGHDR